MQKSMRLAMATAAAVVTAIAVQAGDEKSHRSDKDHVMVRPDDVQWGPAPPGLPVRGQRTRTNARTRKGPKKTVAGKKKARK